MTDVWVWWKQVLEDPSRVDGHRNLVHPGGFECGYYRMRFRGEQWQPIGIFPLPDGTIVGRQGLRDPIYDVEKIGELFQSCCRNPITYQAYMRAIEGSGFVDEPPLAAKAELVSPVDQPDEPGIGHNVAPDPEVQLRQEYLGEKEMADEILKKEITDQAAADRAAIEAQRLLDIANKADDEFTKEKKPILEATRKVGDKWRWREDTRSLATKLKKHQEPWLKKLAREEEQRQAAAAAEAQQLQQAADEAEARAAQAPQGIGSKFDQEIQRLADEAAQKLRESAARTVSAGRTGARVSLTKIKIARVDNFDDLLMALKDRPEIIELVEKLANRAAKAGVELPGMTIVDDKVAR